MWKDSSGESEAGKLLFELYRFKNKPQIYYPPVKTKKKPLPFEESKSKPKEKPVIDYPDLSKPVKSKYHPIDFVPKKKPKDQIQNEIKETQKFPLNYARKGVNREQLKSELQEKFQFSNGILPKTFNTAKAKEVPSKPKLKPAEAITSDPDELFDLITKEIEERQQHLEDLKSFNQLTADKESRLKAEIVVRISELQRLKEITG